MMSDRKVTYWKANKATSAEIARLMRRRQRLFRRIAAFAKEVGADTKYYSWSDFAGTTSLNGLAFDTPPDKKVWKLIKDSANGYRPRVNRKGEIYQKWESLKDTAIRDIMDLIGMGIAFDFVDGGFGFQRPGIRIVDGVAYLAIPGTTIPKGCIRIADTTYEKRTKPKSKRVEA